MEDLVGFSSARSYVVDDDEDICSDRTRNASPDGYSSGGTGSQSFADKRPRNHGDSDHRKRRAIANSNERKRMQSINAGFNSLRNLVCAKSGDKLSKAAILKYTADFIKALLSEKQQLLADNHYLEQLLGGTDLDAEKRLHHTSSQRSPPRPGKRRWREAESSSSDEGIGFTAAEEILVTSSSGSSNVNDQSISELQRQIKELEEQVEKEKCLRLLIEADKKQLQGLQQAPLPIPSTMPEPTSDTSSTNQTPAAIQLPKLHNHHAWRRGLETIVEAIRHVEGEQGMFGPGDSHLLLQQNGFSNSTCTQLKTTASFESSLLNQLHPTCIRDLSGNALSPVSLSKQLCFTPTFHRPSLAVPSS